VSIHRLRIATNLRIANPAATSNKIHLLRSLPEHTGQTAEFAAGAWIVLQDPKTMAFQGRRDYIGIALKGQGVVANQATVHNHSRPGLCLFLHKRQEFSTASHCHEIRVSRFDKDRNCVDSRTKNQIKAKTFSSL
jgi:hypothetical protein